jgi:predicted PurR-regulated permease PerM
MSRVARYTTVILVTLTVLVLLWQIKLAVVLFLLSLVIAAAFRPAIDYLVDHRIPRNIALVLTYLLVIAAFALLFAAGINPLLRDIQSLINSLTLDYDRIKLGWPNTDSPLLQSIAMQLPPSGDLYTMLAGEQGTEVVQGLVDILLSFFEVIGRLGIALVISAYWTADDVHFERLWLSLLAVEQRAWARDVWRDIERNVGAYVRSAVVQAVLAGVLLGVSYRVIGLEYPALLALFAAAARLIPWLGAILALLPVFVVSWQAGPLICMLALAVTIGVFIGLEVLINMRLMPQRGFSSILLVLVLVAMGQVGGLVGVILAPLVAVALQLILGAMSRQRPVEVSSAAIDALGSLNQQLDTVKQKVASHDAVFVPEIVTLTNRLDQLLTKTKTAMNQNANGTRRWS